MEILSLTQEERLEMKRFYSIQYQTTLQNLKHIKSILEKLDDDEFSEVEDYSVLMGPKSGDLPSIIKRSQKTEPSEKKSRGRKSLWGNYILNQLTESNRPLSYSILINTAVRKFHLPENRIKNVKQAITNSAFRLRVINNKIETFGFPGKKERYLCLVEWFDNDVLKPQYRNKIRTLSSVSH